jgi:short-subunit dehydrogenase
MRRFVIDSEDVARAIVRAVERGKREVTLPWFPYRLVSLAQTLAPGLVARSVGRYGYRPGTQD